MNIPVFAHITAATYLVPAGFGIWQFRQLRGPLKVLAVLAVLAVLQLGAELLAAYLYGYNTFESGFYEFIELCLLGSIYLMVARKRVTRSLMLSLIAVYAIVWIIRIPSLFDSSIVATEMTVLDRVLRIVLSVVTLLSLIETEKTHLVDSPPFWIVFGVLLSSAGTLMVMALSNDLLRLGRPYFEVAWHVNWSMSIVSNLFFTKAFLCKQQM